MGACSLCPSPFASPIYSRGFGRISSLLVEVGDAMLILITYDVSTVDATGRRRLTQVAKKCLDYGQRVQNSVFECVLDTTQFHKLKHELKELIDVKSDSLRFYNLGDKYKTKVEHIGVKESYDVEGPLII